MRRSRNGANDASEAPTRDELQAAALAHLARFDASTERVGRVLANRVRRWAARALAGGRDAEEVDAATRSALAVIPAILSRLTAMDLLNDRRFASRRAAVDASSGRSQRASRGRLMARGIDADLAGEVSARTSEVEFEAAIAHARRRRLGPFARPGSEEADDDTLMRARSAALASFARAGFDHRTASRVLGLTLEDATAMLEAARARE